MLPPANRLRFDYDYRERVLLRDGTELLLRRLTDGDGGLLAEAFEHLSAESRRLRFLQAKPRLTRSDIISLTDLDGWDRFALAAVAIREGEEHEAVGVARYGRFGDRPDTADAAVVIVDSYHRMGVASLLLRRLFAAAGERGLKHLVFDMLAENRAMEALVSKLAPHAESHLDGTVLTLHLELSAVVEQDGGTPEQAFPDAPW